MTLRDYLKKYVYKRNLPLIIFYLVFIIIPYFWLALIFTICKLCITYDEDGYIIYTTKDSSEEISYRIDLDITMDEMIDYINKVYKIDDLDIFSKLSMEDIVNLYAIATLLDRGIDITRLKKVYINDYHKINYSNGFDIIAYYKIDPGYHNTFLKMLSEFVESESSTKVKFI